MYIEINDNLLSDAPYCDENKSLFQGTHPLLEDIAEDIHRDNPTCYLVSGYRGSGKTSFITMLEDRVKKKKQEQAKLRKETTETTMNRQSNKEVLFIRSSFSKYHSQTHLLRRLIRALYLSIESTESFKREYADTERGLSRLVREKVGNLYERTFYDKVQSQLSSDRSQFSFKSSIDVKSLITLIVGVFTFSISLSGLIIQYPPFSNIVTLLVMLTSLGVVSWNFIELKVKFSLQKEKQSDILRKSLYDDEIAEYHFINLLKSLSPSYNIVFVMDELDKVENTDLEKLLKEMKPFFVSGLSTFIVVAGQQLYYKYASSRTEDDAILSSIFSKVVHIPLMGRNELRDLFINVLVKNSTQYTELELRYMEQYADYLTLQAKRVPRKFINLIREELTYVDGKAVLIKDVNQSNYKIYSVLLSGIQKVDEQEIAAEGFDPATRDYLVMQLFIGCHVLLFNRGKFISLTQLTGKK